MILPAEIHEILTRYVIRQHWQASRDESSRTGRHCTLYAVHAGGKCVSQPMAHKDCIARQRDLIVRDLLALIEGKAQ